MQGGKSPRNEVIEFSTYAQYLKLIWNFWFLSPKNAREGFRLHRSRIHYKKYEKGVLFRLGQKLQNLGYEYL